MTLGYLLDVGLQHKAQSDDSYAQEDDDGGIVRSSQLFEGLPHWVLPLALLCWGGSTGAGNHLLGFCDDSLASVLIIRKFLHFFLKMIKQNSIIELIKFKAWSQIIVWQIHWLYI